MVVAVLAVGVFSGVAEAYKPADLENLIKTRMCIGGDLSGANLIKANLKGARLNGEIIMPNGRRYK